MSVHTTEIVRHPILVQQPQHALERASPPAPRVIGHRREDFSTRLRLQLPRHHRRRRRAVLIQTTEIRRAGPTARACSWRRRAGQVARSEPSWSLPGGQVCRKAARAQPAPSGNFQVQWSEVTRVLEICGGTRPRERIEDTAVPRIASNDWGMVLGHKPTGHQQRRKRVPAAARRDEERPSRVIVTHRHLSELVKATGMWYIPPYHACLSRRKEGMPADPGGACEVPPDRELLARSNR